VNRFTSMGCEVVVEGATGDEVARVRTLFEERDALFSRFRPDSELNAVNDGSGARLLSPVFARMVEAGLRAREQTGGLVDPTVGAALEAAGYDRDFARLEPSAAPLGTAFRAGTVEVYGSVLVLQRGARLDLNGVVKAAAVDNALGLFPGKGFVSAGGDLAARGEVDVGLPAAVRCGSSRAALRRAGGRSGAGCGRARSSTI
jgi:FAD:protein FMN transferase